MKLSKRITDGLVNGIMIIKDPEGLQLVDGFVLRGLIKAVAFKHGLLIVSLYCPMIRVAGDSEIKDSETWLGVVDLADGSEEKIELAINLDFFHTPIINEAGCLIIASKEDYESVTCLPPGLSKNPIDRMLLEAAYPLS